MQITCMEDGTKSLLGEQFFWSLPESELCLRSWVKHAAPVSSDLGLIYGFAELTLFWTLICSHS